VRAFGLSGDDILELCDGIIYNTSKQECSSDRIGLCSAQIAAWRLALVEPEVRGHELANGVHERGRVLFHHCAQRFAATLAEEGVETVDVSPRVVIGAWRRNLRPCASCFLRTDSNIRRHGIVP
jgi:hypothetical protein